MKTPKSNVASKLKKLMLPTHLIFLPTLFIKSKKTKKSKKIQERHTE